MESSSGSDVLSSSENQALDEFSLLANQWRMAGLADSTQDPAVIPRDVLLKFLMARKFVVQRAFDLFQQHQIMRAERGLDKIDINDEALRGELQSGKFTVLTARDELKGTVAVFTARLHKPHDRAVTLQSILMQLDCAVSEFETQRNGLIVIYDMSAMTWTNFDSKLALDLLRILKGSFPARLNKILVIAMPSWLKVPLDILRPLMTTKMLDRLSFITLDKLSAHVPLKALPNSLGGSCNHSHSEWVEKCRQKLRIASSSTSVKLRSNSNNGGTLHGKGDARRSGQVFSSENGTKISSSGSPMDDLKNSASVHRQSDKGMGVIEFVRMIQSMGKDGILREYEELRTAGKMIPDSQFSVCKSPVNRAKNRYMDVPCFDSSRVKLLGCAKEDDYIHANYVDGYEAKNAYISTQGPLPKTYDDFWMMIWEQETRVVIMTTKTVERGRQKCGQYWPAEFEETVETPSYLVTNNGVQNFTHHVQTDLTLTKFPNMETRTITHLQFTDWPDYGVPHSAQSMFEFIRVMRQFQESALKSMNPSWSGVGKGPPIVVHCSAGIGRSGSLCALDICMRRLDDSGLVNLHQTVQKARAQRCHSIQMPEQYLFCYLALVEYATTRGLISREESGLDEMLTWLQDE